MSNNRKSKIRKRKAFIFALKRFSSLLVSTTLIIAVFSLIIAAVFGISFINNKKSEEYTVKLRTQPLTKAVTVKSGDSSIIKKGYFPISALNGIVGVRVVGDSKGIIVSDPSGTEVLEITPQSNIIKVNGAWMQTEDVVIYTDGECYLPIELVEKYTCLTVSYDEEHKVYTVSSVGTKDIAFFPKNSGAQLPVTALNN